MEVPTKHHFLVIAAVPKLFNKNINFSHANMQFSTLFLNLENDYTWKDIVFYTVHQKETEIMNIKA